MNRGLIRIAILAFAAAAAASADDFVVVANGSVTQTEVSSDELKLVFLGSKTSLGGGPVEPVLAQGGAAHEAFLKACVGKSDAAYRNHLKTQVFTGKGAMPKSLASDTAVLQYVARTKGAIGYVSGAASLGDVKKLSVK